MNTVIWACVIGRYHQKSIWNGVSGIHQSTDFKAIRNESHLLGIHESSTKTSLRLPMVGWQVDSSALEHDGVYGAMGGLITTMEDYGKYVRPSSSLANE
jgi:hypothetical protein